MPTIYCQNSLCEFYKEGKKYLHYGTCAKKEVFIVWQADDEHEVTGYNAECKHSTQDRYKEQTND